jgi:ribokinase
MDLIVEAPRVAGPGETVEGTRFYTTPGGKGGNQAIAAARALGEPVQVEMIARVGDDPYGEQLRRYLADDGVANRFVRVDPSATTGVAVVLIDGTGQNYVNAVYGANASCDAKQVADVAEVLREGDILLVQQEIPLPVTMDAMRLARERNATVILDPAPARTLPAGFLSLVDIITPNSVEAHALTGIEVTNLDSAAHAARAVHALGVRTVLLTLGEDGVYAYGGGLDNHYPAFRVTAVATVAAGDAFNGALAAGLSNGMELRDAIRLAQAAAAISVTRPGAQESMPLRAEIDPLAARD